jgi:hypothetical protein
MNSNGHVNLFVDVAFLMGLSDQELHKESIERMLRVERERDPKTVGDYYADPRFAAQCASRLAARWRVGDAQSASRNRRLGRLRELDNTRAFPGRA